MSDLCECGHKEGSHKITKGETHCIECDEMAAFTCGTDDCQKFKPKIKKKPLKQPLTLQERVEILEQQMGEILSR